MSESYFRRHFGSVYAVPECAVVDSSKPTPFGKRSTYAIKGYDIVCSSVVGLSDLCRPSAVRRFVVSVIVDAVNRAFRTWAFAHVSKESCKGLPIIANRYTSVSVIGMSRKVLVFTSRNHVRPAAIGSRISQAMRFTSCGSEFVLQASTRLGTSLPNVVSVYNAYGSAITNAKPLALAFVGVFGSCCNRPASESLTSKVFEFCHSALLNVKHLKVHGKQRCSCGSGATLAMQGGF